VAYELADVGVESCPNQAEGRSAN